MKRIISLILISSFLSPIFAIDVQSMGLNVPSIQSITAADKSMPVVTGDMVMEAPIDPNSYCLGPGDVLSIRIIIGNGELSVDHDLFIGADGKIFFPNIGEIYLSGISLTHAKQKIDRQIKSIYRERYELSVLLKQPKKVKIYLTGMIKTPGPIAVYDDQRISEVIAQAGGVVSGGSNRYIYIKRKDANGEEVILTADLFEAFRSRDISKDIRIQAGDVIEVPDIQSERMSDLKAVKGNDKLLFEGKETFVYVYGEVARSGRFEFVPGKKISDYISFAGGPTPKALMNQVTLTRHENGDSKKYTIDVSDVIYNGNSKNDVEILGGDVVSIPGNFFYVSDFSSFANTVILALTLYSAFKR